MRASEIAIQMGAIGQLMEVQRFISGFQPTTKVNSVATLEVTMDEAMCEFVLASHLNALWKRRYDKAKKKLDEYASQL